ncbi:MAG: CAP domain-containing protein [Alistipes senegalensis]|nr:CAP domain-containing protein [Alistipes senegalensis]
MKKTNIFTKAVSVIAAAIMTVSANAINTNASDETSDYTAMTERLVYLVNEARTESGLEPIYAVPYLNELAEERAEECMNNPIQARIGGNSFITIVDYDIAPWSTAAEIVASGMATPEETFEQWKNSPSQWSAIMNPDFTHMGVGVTYDPESENGWYWEQLFITVDVFERPDGDIEGQYLPDEFQIVPQVAGDINGDGMVDSFDYLLICRYVNNQITLDSQQIKCADILRDGNVGYSDAAVLRQYILGENIKVPVKLS